MIDSYFSDTYAEARHRFADAATTAGATLTGHRVDADSQDDLVIDVALLGTEGDPSVVVSSGVHGVEGFFGSAVQLALLDRLKEADSLCNVRYVLIHAVNPFGFSHLRRFNQDNVDLNRNFLTSSDSYAGAPEGYAALNSFLNPESSPSRFEPFRLKALWHIWRKGLQTLKQAVAGGQYEYPRGLFFGGKGPCHSTRIVQENCDSWIGSSQRVVHVDLHTGLGAFGTYKLLITDTSDSEHYPWYTETFGPECVEPFSQTDGTAYRVSGSFDEWMQNHFSARDYRFAGAEFGTYGVIRVLAALRAENRAHYYSPKGSPSFQRAKKELLECFCPNDPAWRRKVVESALGIIDQGRETLLPSGKEA